MADEIKEFPRTLYKHQDPLTRTVMTQDEQDKFTAEGWSTQARPQEQYDHEHYLKDHPEATEDHSEEHHEALKEEDAHDYKADIVKPEEGTV